MMEAISMESVAMQTPAVTIAAQDRDGRRRRDEQAERAVRAVAENPRLRSSFTENANGRHAIHKIVAVRVKPGTKPYSATQKLALRGGEAWKVDKYSEEHIEVLCVFADGQGLPGRDDLIGNPGMEWISLWDITDASGGRQAFLSMWNTFFQWYHFTPHYTQHSWHWSRDTGVPLVDLKATLPSFIAIVEQSSAPRGQGRSKGRGRGRGRGAGTGGGLKGGRGGPSPLADIVLQRPAQTLPARRTAPLVPPEEAGLRRSARQTQQEDDSEGGSDPDST